MSPSRWRRTRSSGTTSSSSRQPHLRQAAADDPALAILASLATYGVGFAARPLGGLLFGSFGDRHGRTAALLWKFSLMGLVTFAIGLLPTYEQAGIWAVAGLVGLRIAQGIVAGGEWGGGVLLIAENSPPGRMGVSYRVVPARRTRVRPRILSRTAAFRSRFPRLGLAGVVIVPFGIIAS